MQGKREYLVQLGSRSISLWRWTNLSELSGEITLQNKAESLVLFSSVLQRVRTLSCNPERL